MNNSSLASLVMISPNKTVGWYEKDTVTIHCTAVDVSAKRIGEIFQPSSKNASCTYGIGNDGEVVLVVDEKDRSWCSSNRENDERAITIEVSSSNEHPYQVSKAAYDSLISLLVDICQRNPKLAGGLKWKADKSLIGNVAEQNMTVHRWFANKACPGDYLYNLHTTIAEEVNYRLGLESSLSKVVVTDTNVYTPVLIQKGTVLEIAEELNGYGRIENTNSWIKMEDLGDISEEKEPTSNLVKITANVLNVRSGASTGYPVVTHVYKDEVYTITETSGNWGKLKSGAGWIHLDFVIRV